VTAPLSVPAQTAKINLDGPKVHHLVGWSGYGDPKRLEVIRSVAVQRGRDPRIATLAVNIIRKAGVLPRDYKGQIAALLAWVQDPKNVYYINEPGERLQDPLYTLKVKYGDCDDLAILLCSMFESCRISWKLVISGRDRATGRKVRHVDGDAYKHGVDWSHIYCIAGTPVFRPTKWFFCEPTLKVPLGWDVVSGDASVLPEMAQELGKRSPNSRIYRATGSLGAFPFGNGAGTAAAAISSAVTTQMEGEEGKKGTSGQPANPFALKRLAPAIAISVTTAVCTSVLSQLILDKIRSGRKAREAAQDSKE